MLTVHCTSPERVTFTSAPEQLWSLTICRKQEAEIQEEESGDYIPLFSQGWDTDMGRIPLGHFPFHSCIIALSYNQLGLIKAQGFNTSAAILSMTSLYITFMNILVLNPASY